MQIPYTTVEQIAQSLEVLNSAYASTKIYAAILSSSRSAEGFLHRRFYPERRTIRKDWPNNSYSPTWQLDLDDQEIVSLIEVTSGGTDITASCVLRRGDDLAEPPYSSIQIDLSSNASFSAGTTWQRSMELEAVFGYNDTDTSFAGATLSGAINSSVVSATFIPANGQLTPGIGSLIQLGTEKMLVRGRSMLTTGQTTTSALQANNGATSFTTAGAASLSIGETILIDAERLRINDIAGSTVVVSRAWDGTALAQHASGSTIYGLRNYTLQRGVLGTTAASQSDATPVYVHEYPALLNQLVIAETIVSLQQNAAAYARTIGSGAGTREAAGLGLDDIRERAWRELGRKARLKAI